MPPFFKPGEVVPRNLNPFTGRHFGGAAANPLLNVADRVQLDIRLGQLCPRYAHGVAMRFDEARDDRLTRELYHPRPRPGQRLNIVVRADGNNPAIADSDRLSESIRCIQRGDFPAKQYGIGWLLREQRVAAGEFTCTQAEGQQRPQTDPQAARSHQSTSRRF
jgi:hypothetical protein